MKFAVTFLFNFSELSPLRLEIFESGLFIDLIFFSFSIVDLNAVQELIEEEKVVIEYQ